MTGRLSGDMLRLVLVNCWSLFVLSAYPCLCLAAFFFPPLQKQLQGRLRKFLLFCGQTLRGQKKTGGWIFFCSSAGEYEQAVPVLTELAGKREEQLVLFFSHSGYRFATLRCERAHCLLAPPDLWWLWWLLLVLWRPRGVVVVRHELWPAFLCAAARRSKLYLIDASFPHLRGRWLKSWLLGFFRKVLVVDELDRVTALHHLHVPQQRLIVAGDSKYDRVAQRVAAPAPHDKSFALLRTPGKRRRLLIGSAWQEEILAVLDIYRKQRARWQVLIAPHTPHVEMLDWLQKLCRQKKLQVRFYTQLSLPYVDADVIVIDTMGCLTELYGLAHLALVGGGMRGKVHNVLEPVFHGIPTAMGKYFANSSEARRLFDAGWLTVVDTDNLASWWQAQTTKSYGAERRAQQLAFVHELCGATRLIGTVLDSTP